MVKLRLGFIAVRFVNLKIEKIGSVEKIAHLSKRKLKENV